MSIQVNRSRPRSVSVTSSIKPSVTVRTDTQEVSVSQNVIVGPPGTGIPTGGNPGEILVKSGTGDYVTEWSLLPTTRYVHAQSSPSTQWNITHTLGGRPSVTIVDSAGTTVIGEVQYLSDTNVVVSFTSPFSGSAYLT